MSGASQQPEEQAMMPMEDLRQDMLASEIAAEIAIQEQFDRFDKYVGGRFQGVHQEVENLRSEIGMLKQFLRHLLMDTAVARTGKALGELGEEERRDVAREAFLRHPRARQIGVVVARSVASPPDGIDCENRLPICRAACCTMRVPLTEAEIGTGSIPFDPDFPFYMQWDGSGVCPHLKAGRCGRYESRPTVCREYDCRKDKRVWQDFEKSVPGPIPRRLAMPSTKDEPAGKETQGPTATILPVESQGASVESE